MTQPHRRVVHVDTEPGWGGGQRQVFWLATRLSRHGWESWAVAREGSRLARLLRQHQVPVTEMAPAFEWDPLAVLRLRALIRRVRPALVHAHAAHAVALAAAAVLGTATRLVVSRRVALPLRRNALSRWKYRRAALFVAVSERVGRALLESGVAPGRVRVARSGIDVECAVGPATPATLASLGIERVHPLVVMVSALTPPHKDPETFVRGVAAAVRNGGPVHALLVGDGPLRSRVARLVGQLGLGGVVHLAGYRDDAESLIAAADVAVLASRDEGLGTAVLDAMLAGRPVVATAAGGVLEVIRDGVDGVLVPVGDAEALGRAIARLLGDAALRERLAAAARRRAREFDVDRTVDATHAVYEEVLGGRA